MNPFPTYTEACTAVCASKQLEVPGSLRFATHNIFGAWRSPVAHLLWEQGVPSSNLGAPTGERLCPASTYTLAGFSYWWEVLLSSKRQANIRAIYWG